MYLWTTPKKQFSAEELAWLLLIESAIPQSKICSKQPVRVCHNVSSVINLHALDDPKDVRADENGVWQRNGSPVTYVSIHGQSSGAKVFRRTNMGNHSHHYKVSRTYYRHSNHSHSVFILLKVKFFSTHQPFHAQVQNKSHQNYYVSLVVAVMKD